MSVLESSINLINKNKSHSINLKQKNMNVYYEAIQKSFDLLKSKKVKKPSFETALEYMVKLAKNSDYYVEKCVFSADKERNVIISLNTKDASLTITANDRTISYTGTGPKKEDNFQTVNTESYIVSVMIFEWIKRNRK